MGDPMAKDKQHGVFIWLMRVAAYLREDTPSKTHYQQLQNYYIQSPDSHYNTIGRYLLGMANQEALLARMTSKKAFCEIAYYIGFKAQTEGRYLNASKLVSYFNRNRPY